MAGQYRLWLTNDTGRRLLSMRPTLFFSASRVLNGIGRFELHVPATFDPNYLQMDYMLQVWRAAPASAFKLHRVYFLRRWRFERKRSAAIIKMYGPCCNELLARRIVAHYEGEAESEMTDYADDMMKEIVTDSVTDGTTPAPDAGTRAWTDFGVAAQEGAGPTLTKEFGWRRLLETSGAGLLVDIAGAAKIAGTEVWFDIQPIVSGSSNIKFIFRTYTSQPGRDLTRAIVFDEARGTLSNPYLEKDFTKEVNYVYAGGEGEEDERHIEQVYDSERYLASAWNRREGFTDVRSDAEDDSVREQGRTFLKINSPILKAGGDLQDSPAFRYGRHWEFGDRVRFRSFGEEYEGLVDNVTLSMRRGAETVLAKVEYSEP